MSERILIIGAGQAGMQIAVSLRDDEFDGTITLIGEEPHGPYQRPPLSKAYLLGEADVESLELRTPQFYVDNRITVISDEKVVKLFWGDEHGVAVTDTGREIAFDKLALTTGSYPRRLECEGSDLDGVLYMHDLHDANELKARWDAAKKVVVIGGGFIGLEVAGACEKFKKDVTVVHSRDRLMSRSVGTTMSEFFLEAHKKRGATVILSSRATCVHGENGKVTGVELADGTVLPADIVVVGIGAHANVELAEQLGLTIENGAVVVDNLTRTSDPRVVATGDVAILPHPLTGEGLVRLESVQNAIDQSKTAAKTLMGGTEPYAAVPWFWSDQADLKLQMAGLSTGYDQEVVRGNPAEDKFSVLYYKNGRIIAVDSVNDVLDYMAVRRALGAGQNIPADAAADSSVALKTLVTD